MSHETFELIDQLRRTGGRAVMATLIRTSGTTPRKEGAKMFVGDDGAIFGSVTIGGCVDARVIEHSAEVFATTAPQLVNLQLGDEEAWEIGLTCGGAVDIFVEPLTDELIECYDKARQELQAGRSLAMATLLSGQNIGAHILSGDGVAAGPELAELREPLNREVRRMLRSATGSRTVVLGEQEIYIEILQPASKLLIFGAGAVAIPLVSFARNLGFQTVIIDGRSRFANRERFPDAGDIQVGIVSEIVAQIELGPTTPVVLVTHDAKIEIPVLKRVLASSAPYVGLLGSRRRGAAILDRLREEGVPEDQLARIRVPVGLNIGGETAAEIALSIIAEVVAMMHGRSGFPMSGQSVEPADNGSSR